MTANPAPAPVRADDPDAMLRAHGTYMSYPKAAETLGCSVRTLKRETAAGRLKCYSIGRTQTLRVKTLDVVNLATRVA